MPHHRNRRRAGKPTRCLDCGQPHRHDDTCPQRSDLLDLLDVDVAALAAQPGRPYTRPLHRVERSHLQALGCHAPRGERGRWTVEVRLIAGGVHKVIRRDGRPVAQMDDTAIESGVR